jgi:HSP20 family protein
MKLVRYHNSPIFNTSTRHAALHDELDRLFNSAFPTLSTFQRDGFFGNSQNEFPVDLYEEQNAFVVRAEVPGFKKEDLAVEVANGVLTVTGHQKTETTTDAEKKSTQERKVSRAISLPEHVQVDKIQATYEAGVLTVKLPKSEQVKPKQITVEVK